ncbi:MAG: hypothetical protein ABIY70_08805 [Capsulimonas sp.]|uniref:hypothetical protein n=1 Tax=Capsulimonas sp. TaxID=2494211 RepID=UPI003264CDC5
MSQLDLFAPLPEMPPMPPPAPKPVGEIVEGWIKNWPAYHKKGGPIATLEVTPRDGFTYEATIFEIKPGYRIAAWPSGIKHVECPDGEALCFYLAAKQNIVRVVTRATSGGGK